MARSILEQLVVEITADNAKLRSGLRDAEQQTATAAQRLGASARQIGTVVAATTTAVAAVGGAFIAAANRAASYADEVDKAAIRTRLSRGAVQELRFVTDQLGGSFAVVETAVVGLTQRLAGAEQGSERQAQAFARLGIATRDASGSLRGTEELLFDSIAALQGVTNETERAVLAQEVFGRSAAQLAPILAAGAGSVDELRARARDLGLVLDDQSVGSLVQYKDQLSAVQQQFGALQRDITLQFLPVLTDGVLPAVQEAITLFRGLPEPVRNTATQLTALGAALSAAAVASRLLGTSLLPVLGPAGLIAGGAILVTNLATAFFDARSGISDYRTEIDGLARSYESYRGEIVATTEQERRAAVARLETLRTELQERLRLLEELAASQATSVQRFIDSPIGRFLLPGFIQFEGGASVGTLEEIERVRGVIGGIGSDIDALLGGASTLVPSPAAAGVSGAGVASPAVAAAAAEAAEDIVLSSIAAIPQDLRPALGTPARREQARLRALVDSVGRGAADIVEDAIDNTLSDIASIPQDVRPALGTARRTEESRLRSLLERTLRLPGDEIADLLFGVESVTQEARFAAAAAVGAGVPRGGGPTGLAPAGDGLQQIRLLAEDTVRALVDANAPLASIVEAFERLQRVGGGVDEALEAQVRGLISADAGLRSFTQRLEALSGAGREALTEQSQPVDVATGAFLEGVAERFALTNAAAADFIATQELLTRTVQRAEGALGLGVSANEALALELEALIERTPLFADTLRDLANALRDADAAAALAAQQREQVQAINAITGATNGLINSVRDLTGGNAGQGVGGLFGVAGGLVSTFVNPVFGAILSGLGSVIGNLFGGRQQRGNLESRAAGAAARGAPSVELNLQVFQNIGTLGLDPNSRGQVDAFLNETVGAVQGVLERVVLPRLGALEERVEGLA